jgi:hypothetical protein
MFLGAVLICSLPIAWIFVELGFGVYSIGMALFLMSTVCSLGRIWFARKLVKMSARIWLYRVVAPIFLTMIVSFVVGFIPRVIYAPSFYRLCFTTMVIEVTLLPLSWLFILDSSERDFLKSKAYVVLGKLKRK